MEVFMRVSINSQPSKLITWPLKSLLVLAVCVGLLIFNLAAPAMAGVLPVQNKNSSSQTSSSQTSLSQTNKAIALRYAQEGWGTQPHWEQVWDELVAPDMVLHFNSFPEPIVGLAANKAFSKDLFDGFPTIQNTIETVVAEGDTVIYRSTLEGEQTGSFLGMPATGKKVKMNDFTMVKIENGKIKEQWYETNLLSLMQQLGLAP
jgi:predicted ester cyclase